MIQPTCDNLYILNQVPLPHLSSPLLAESPPASGFLLGRVGRYNRYEPNVPSNIANVYVMSYDNAIDSLQQH